MDEPIPLTDVLQDRLNAVERKLAELQAAQAQGPPGLSARLITNEAVPGGFWGRLLHMPKLAVRMYVDPRYRLSRVAQLALPIFFILLAFNYALWNYLVPLPVFSTIMERLTLIALTLVLYNVIAAEVERYRNVLDYLARYGSPAL